MNEETEKQKQFELKKQPEEEKEKKASSSYEKIIKLHGSFEKYIAFSKHEHELRQKEIESYKNSIYYKYPYMKSSDIEKMLEERNKKNLMR
jgi:hypothetical protein